MSSLRCANCDYWLGESVVKLVPLDHVAKGDEATVSPPRDLRKCSACGRVTVFVALRDLAQRAASDVA